MSDWVLITASMVMFVSLFGALGLALIAWRRQAVIRGWNRASGAIASRIRASMASDCATFWNVICGSVCMPSPLPAIAANILVGPGRLFGNTAG